MGKKLSQASMKISKDDHKKQLNSLIKILRPKVYITDPCNFKNLVQELTGNGDHQIQPSVAQIQMSPPPCMPQSFEEVIPIIEVEDDLHHYGCEKTSPELSDSSVPTSVTFGSSSPELCIPEETFNMLESSMASAHDVDFASCFDQLDQPWQQEMDPFCYNYDDAYVPKFQQEDGHM